MRPAVLPPDPDHPLHRASYWLDRRKLVETAGGPGALVGTETITVLLGELLAANDLDLDASRCVEAIRYYAQSFVESTGGPAEIIGGVFFDGFCHALALAAGIEADPPEYPDVPPGGERVH